MKTNNNTGASLELTADSVTEQFRSIDVSAFPENIRSVISGFENIVREFFDSKRPKIEAGPRYGFRSSYLEHGKSEEESVILEMLEELFDALCYLMIFKHMYRKGHPGSMIPALENVIREAEEGILGLVLVGRVLLHEAEKLVALRDEVEADRNNRHV